MLTAYSYMMMTVVKIMLNLMQKYKLWLICCCCCCSCCCCCFYILIASERYQNYTLAMVFCSSVAISKLFTINMLDTIFSSLHFAKTIQQMFYTKFCGSERTLVARISGLLGDTLHLKDLLHLVVCVSHYHHATIISIPKIHCKCLY